MKTTFKFLPLIVLLLALSGCAAHKTAVKSDTTIAPASAAESEVSYKQALAAIEARRFIIKADGEFEFPDGVLKYSPDSYISMDGEQMIVRFAQNLFPRVSLGKLMVEYTVTELTQKRKNGNIQYQVTAEKDKFSLQCKILIVLYANTNQCYVQLYDGLYDTDPIRFKGTVCPAED